MSCGRETRHRRVNGWTIITTPLFWGTISNRFTGPVEVDETFTSGKLKNKHSNKKLKAGRSTVGKAIIVGTKDCDTNRVSATVVKGNGRQNASGLRRRLCSGTRDGLHRRPRWISGNAVRAQNCKAQHQRVREQHGSHQRNRVVLGATQARLPRYLPPHEQEASRALCDEFAGRHNVPEPIPWTKCPIWLLGWLEIGSAIGV